MNYTHDNATWQTDLTPGETVKLAGRSDHYEGCTGRVIGLLDGAIAVLLGHRARTFCPHELARPDGTPHITLVAGKPKVINRPLTTKEPTTFREFTLRGAAKQSAERKEAS